MTMKEYSKFFKELQSWSFIIISEFLDKQFAFVFQQVCSLTIYLAEYASQ